MPLSRLGGTRYFAKKRAATLLILTLLLVSNASILLGIYSHLTAGTATIASSSEASASTKTELLTISGDVLLQLVNESDVGFIRSHGNVTYYIVTSIADPREVRGLVYLTTDVALPRTYGYNSYVSFLVFVNTTGTIESLEPWHMQESWGYLVSDFWLRQFIGRSVFDPLQIGKDVNGITGATYTSNAVTGGVREAGRIVVDDYNAKKGVPTGSVNQFVAVTFAMIQQVDLVQAAVMLGVFCLALLAYETNNDRLKYIVLGAVIIYLGIYTGRMVSIIDITQLMFAAFPPLFLNLYWYVLFGSMFVTSLILGRLYCGYICPFGAFIAIAHQISPIKRRIPIKIHSKLVYIKYPILAGVAVGVLFGRSWITGIEPFQTFFHLKGDWWMWVVMASAVVFSIPFNRFYCSYICPAGAVMALSGRLRIMEIKRWPECERCKICEHDCPEGAILGPKISVLECMNCRECEKNYLDHEICPHYALERTRPFPIIGA